MSGIVRINTTWGGGGSVKIKHCNDAVSIIQCYCSNYICQFQIKKFLEILGVVSGRAGLGEVKDLQEWGIFHCNAQVEFVRVLVNMAFAKWYVSHSLFWPGGRAKIY